MNVLQGRSLLNPLSTGPDGSLAADSPCRLVHHRPIYMWVVMVQPRETQDHRKFWGVKQMQGNTLVVVTDMKAKWSGV